MPTVLRKAGFRFFFYSNDHEPKHIHVEKENSTAKYLLSPVELIKSRGFNSKEISDIRRIILEHQKQFIIFWNEYFNRK